MLEGRLFQTAGAAEQKPRAPNEIYVTTSNLPDNLPDKASPGETGSASRVTQTEIVYKVTHLYNVFPIAA